MTATSIVRALIGGGLIGIAASIVLGVHGRIAGISGILGHALDRDDTDDTDDTDNDGARAFRLAFLLGLIATGVIAVIAVPSAIGASVRGLPMLAIAGVLVGVGTTVGNGCTSGHGVCGVSRGSARSIVAVLVFIGTGALTVALVGAHS